LFFPAHETFARLSRSTRLVAVGLWLWSCGWQTPPALPGAEASFRAQKLAEMDEAINQAIADKKCPGGVLWVEHSGVAYHRAYGHRALAPSVEPMTEDTIFDAASLTKVIACAPAAMLLIERGKLKLDDLVQSYIPEFTGEGKEAITVRQLMTHTSGLPPDIETKSDWRGQAAAVEKACQEKLQDPPGLVFRYSDINYFLLGEIVQRVGGVPLEQFVAREIYQPLKIPDTGFLPPASKLGRIAPTEVVEGKAYRGVVHDPPRATWEAWPATPGCSQRLRIWRATPGCCSIWARSKACACSSPKQSNS